MSTSNRPAPPRPEHYEAIEQALLESSQGRWFLAEFARRNRTADTQLLINAIGRLEGSIQQPSHGIDLIRRDLIEMSEAIARTRVEIASIKAPDGNSHVSVSATEELDSIVTATERATSEILAAVEAMQEALWGLREEPGLERACNAIQDRLTEVITACSFQDITGQRIQKVVQVLRFLESRVHSIIEIWDIDDGEIEEAAPPEAGSRRQLLNGPQNERDALKQADVDSIIDTLDEVGVDLPADIDEEGNEDLELAEIATTDEDARFDPPPEPRAAAMPASRVHDANDDDDGAAASSVRPRLPQAALLPEIDPGDLDPVKREALFS